MTFWTQPRIDQLRALSAQGKSFTESAEILGTTRNAVAGKAFREGIEFVCTREKHRELVRAGVKHSWATGMRDRRAAAERMRLISVKRWARYRAEQESIQQERSLDVRD